MEEIVWRKFRQNSVLRKELLRTGDEQLQEGNRWHDVEWGVDIKSGVGWNKLGQILMKIRDKLRTLPVCPHCKNNNGLVKFDHAECGYTDCICVELIGKISIDQDNVGS